MMLKRGIGRWDLVLLFINGTIGAGIFGLPSKIFALAGLYSLLALLLCAVIVFVLVWVFAEVAGRFEQTGGPYLYTLEAFGEVPAFAIGWLILITRVATYAALINLMVTYLGYFFPPIQEAVPRSIFMTAFTAVLVMINFVGIQTSTSVNNFLAFAKLTPLAIFILLGWHFIEPDLIQYPASFPPISDFSATILVLFFAFTGFEAILVNTGEMREPRKNIPFALVVAMIIIALFYGAILYVCIGNLPTLATSTQPVTEAAQVFMGFPGTVMITIGAVFSVSGTLNSVMLIASRLPFAMSEGGQLPKRFSQLHPRYQTPVFSLIVFAILSLVMSLTGSFIYAVSISVISKVMIFLSVCLVNLKKRHASSTDKNMEKWKYGSVFSFLGAAFSIYLLASSKGSEFLAVIIATIAGLGVYFLYKKLQQKE